MTDRSQQAAATDTPTAAEPADRYGVLGNPIGHSKSPAIHRLFAEQTGQNIDYCTELVAIDGFDDFVDRYRAAGGKGCNVTLPFKQLACSYADTLSAAADRAGAANTLVFRDGMSFADNTDGIGLVRDLERNHGIQIKGAAVLLLGAGGAARGALQPLLAAAPRRLAIVNRTAAKAADLAAEFSDLGAILGGEAAMFDGQEFDLIINATSASIDAKLPDIPAAALRPTGCCYDMMYAMEPTAFVHWGQQQGAAQSHDGLGMLVEQAAESFFIWRGVRPDTGPVIAHLRHS